MPNDPYHKIAIEALNEDVGKGDLTTKLLIPRNQKSEAFLELREPAVIFGLEIASIVFKMIDPGVQCRALCPEGKYLPAKSRIMAINGKTRAILTGERVALNFLSHLSGIATTTFSFVQKTKPYRVKIMDTRKTMPGLRSLEKQAVKAGGGFNHRESLDTMVLIKDNHKIACWKNLSLADMIIQARKKTTKLVEVEVENLKEFREALGAQPDIILLDNMKPLKIKEAIRLTRHLKHKPLLEISGGITSSNIERYAKTGVDRISIGALTHSHQSIDISLEFIF